MVAVGFCLHLVFGYDVHLMYSYSEVHLCVLRKTNLKSAFLGDVHLGLAALSKMGV